MARIFQVGDLLVHAVNDLKIFLLLTLVQTLQICGLYFALAQQILAFSGSAHRSTSLLAVTAFLALSSCAQSAFFDAHFAVLGGALVAASSITNNHLFAAGGRLRS